MHSTANYSHATRESGISQPKLNERFLPPHCVSCRMCYRFANCFQQRVVVVGRILGKKEQEFIGNRHRTRRILLRVVGVQWFSELSLNKIIVIKWLGKIERQTLGEF